jgi:hypothetical protein
MIVAKAPASGQTKTRLAASLGYDGAADLYRCMLNDVVDIVRRVPNVQRAIAYHPVGSEKVFNRIAPDFALVLQQGRDLGERLHHVLSQCLNNGYDQAAVLSSDAPFVDPNALLESFDALDNGVDVSLGPCDDGGYYIMTVREPRPELLLPIQMSTPNVLRDTLDAASKSNLRVHLLPPTMDIDTPDDLAQLQQIHWRDDLAPNTRRWLTHQMPLQR